MPSMNQMTRAQIWEAIESGSRACDLLEQALEKLNSARGWGIADIFGGKGFVTAMKHSRMEEADALLNDARIQLNDFAEKLDGYYTFHVRAETSTALHVLDYLADNALIDLMIQSKINQARNEIKRTIDDVNQMLDELGEEAARLG